MTASQKLIQASAGVGGGSFYPYSIDNSCRFNQEASPLTRTPTSGNNTTWTFSCWIKTTDNHGNSDTANLWRTAGGLVDTSIRMTDSTESTYPGILQPYAYNNGYVGQDRTNAVYRDVSAWYHILWVVDTTNATEADRSIVYVNGVRQSLIAMNSWTLNGNTAVWTQTNYLMRYFGGYAADVIMLDGTAASPTDFGEDKNGVWVPKDPSGLTFGTNGFWLDFADSANLGNDVSGNGNDFTVSGLTSSDQMIDTPTNNFATWNAVDAYTSTFSDGNLSTTTGNSSNPSLGTMSIPSTGEWYWEVTVDTVAEMSVGVVSTPYAVGNRTTYYRAGGASNSFYIEGSVQTESGASYTNGDVIGVYVNSDSSEISWYKNGSLQGGTAFTLPSLDNLVPLLLQTSGTGTCSGTVNFGQSAFAYTPPGSALALCTSNLPEPTLGPNSAENVTDYFAPVLYTGNGTAIGSGGKSVSVGFQPDFTWIKNRDAADSHQLYDAVRGVTKYLVTNTADAQGTDTEGLASFDADGITVGNNVGVNTSTEDYVAWNWKANGSGVTNNDGSVTSTVSVNQGAGISIATFNVGTGTTDKTYGHGLGTTPACVIMKATTSNGTAWWVWHKDFPNINNYIYLHSSLAALGPDANIWGNSGFTSTTCGFRSNYTFIVSDDVVSYNFAEVEGFSSFGSYTGNGSTTDGPFIYTGFRPAWVMIKRTDSANSWFIHDTSRDTYNGAYHLLYTDGSAAEVTYGVSLDILSNGFKLQTAGSPYANGFNASGGSYIYLAFAEMPFKYANAR